VQFFLYNIPQDKSSTSNLKIEALTFTRLVLASHSPPVFHPYIKVINSFIREFETSYNNQVSLSSFLIFLLAFFSYAMFYWHKLKMSKDNMFNLFFFFEEFSLVWLEDIWFFVNWLKSGKTLLVNATLWRSFLLIGFVGIMICPPENNNMIRIDVTTHHLQDEF